MDKFAAAAALKELGALLRLAGENPFKIRAYDRAARSLEAIQEDLALLVEQGRLTEIEGIGEAIAAKVAELLTTGKLHAVERLKGELSPGVVELSRLPNLGPEKIKVLYRELGITSLEGLRVACEAKKVRTIAGFGERTEAKLLAAIQGAETKEKRTLLVSARREGEALLDYLRGSPAVERAEAGGSLRRWKETVSDLDFVVASRAPGAVMDHFEAYPQVARREARGSTKCSVQLAGGMPVDLRVLPPEDFATAWHHFTGSQAHHTRLRGLARSRGLTVSEWGVLHLEGPQAGQKVPVASEAELYGLLGLPYIPPELREDEGEIEAGLAGEDFADLVESKDIRGMVHAHTVYSDGRHTIAEMAQAAETLGMEYLTITDHSPNADYAGGLSLEQLKFQWEEIARVQEQVKVRLLRGTEADILADGSIDYPDAVLERFDVIIASIHQRYAMDSDRMTERLIHALRRPQFKIWGHPLGRLVLRRDPIACRVEEVLDAVAEARAAIEINGDPHRLDLEPRWIRAARQRGIRFVISTDAHSTAAQGNHLPYGVAMARRGGVRRGEVLNALGVEAFAAAVRPV